MDAKAVHERLVSRLGDRITAANLLADAVRDGFDPRVRIGTVPV